MAKEKVTITVDRSTVREVIRLTGATSTSAAIDLALNQLLHAERLKQDIAAYLAEPQTPDEIAIATYRTHTSNIEDGTDWASEYPQIP
jgi:Arc/MetJ family transcription regulator